MGFIISLLTLGAIVTYLAISYSSDVIDVRNNIKKSEEIDNSTKLIMFNASRSVTSKSDNSDLSNIKMSVFSEDTHSTKDRELMDNFQKAIEHLIINENKIEPTCSEIAETKFITEKDCNNLKEKTYHAITFKNNQLGLKNETLLSIIENKNLSTNRKEDSKTESNSIFYIKNYSKDIIKSDREAFKKNLEFSNQLIESFKFFEDENELLDYGKAVFKTNNNRDTLDVFTVYRLDLILNEINNLKYKKELKLAIDSEKSEEEIALLKEQNKINNLLHDNDKYFSNNSSFFEERFDVIKNVFN